MSTPRHLIAFVANLAELRAMSKSEIERNTCRVCQATYVAHEYVDQCKSHHKGVKK